MTPGPVARVRSAITACVAVILIILFCTCRLVLAQPADQTGTRPGPGSTGTGVFMDRVGAGERVGSLSLATVASPDRLEQPLDVRATVTAFCSLDAEGGGLGSQPQAKRMWSLTTGEGERAGFPIVLISAFKIRSVRQASEERIVTVDYRVVAELGMDWDGLTGHPLRIVRKTETATFLLKQASGHWAIDMSLVPLPHVFPRATAEHIRKVVAMEPVVPDPDRELRQERLKALVAELQRLAERSKNEQ